MRISLAAALALLPLISTAYEIKGKVINVADGDTVTIMTADYAKHKIRLSGIDAPEKSQPFGKKSKQILKQLIGGANNDADAPPVKLSRNKICHGKGTKYYNRVKRFKRFEAIDECLKFGRLPKR